MPVRRLPLRWLLGAAAALAVSNSIGIAFAPTLLTHAPLALAGLSPLSRHLVLIATRVELAPFLMVALVARMLGSVLAYLGGEGYGEQGMAYMHARHPRAGRILAVLERWFERAAPLLLFLMPGPLFCALAGAARMPLWVFGVIAAAGQAMAILIIYRLGEWFEQWLNPIVDFFREHMVSATLVCVLAVLAYRLLRRTRQAAELRNPDLPNTGSSGE